MLVNYKDTKTANETEKNFVANEEDVINLFPLSVFLCNSMARTLVYVFYTGGSLPFGLVFK